MMLHPVLTNSPFNLPAKIPRKKAERVEIELEAGKTYYIQLIFQTGLIKNNLYCQEVTKSSAKTMMDKLKEDNCQL